MGTMTKRLQCLLFLCAFTSAASTAITISEDGGYSRILVALSPQINPTEIKHLLPKLEAIFSSASQFLYISTFNQTYFQEIVFLLPKAVSDLELPDGITVLTERKYHTSPDVIVTDKGIFGSNPFTIQNSGCQEEGLYIKLPTSFLNNKSQDFAEKAKILIREWAHFRYGVFAEHGFSGDKLYPLYYHVPGQISEEPISVTSCSNENVVYKWQNDFGTQCLPESSASTDCIPVPDKEENKNILSSIMYDSLLPQVSHFCDDEVYKHNRNAPTKQNTLCKEESTWKIISKHDDFRFRRFSRMPNFVPTVPSFKYIKESDIKLVFVIESTENMNENGKMDVLRNAFTYFLLYDFPVNSMVGIINSKFVSSKPNPLFVSIKSTESRERVVDAFPEAYGIEEICTHCGIFKALKVLNNGEESVSSGSIVLVTTIDISAMWIENVTVTLKEQDVKLFVIYFSDSNNQSLLLENLAIIAGGKFFYIPETTKNYENLVPLTLLYETFRSIQNFITWTQQNDVAVSYKAFNGSMITETISFTVDESVEKFRLLLTGPNFILGPPVLRDKVILEHDSSIYRAGHPSFSYKMTIPAFVFNIEKPKAGTWRFHFERKPNYASPLVVIIRATQHFQNEAITVRPLMKFLHGVNKPPVIIYAEVNKGEQPILKANVSAIILHPNSERVSLLELNDGGEGDPDITGNDGIYSRYFTDFSTSGYYTLAVIAQNDSPLGAKMLADLGRNTVCCGSVIRKGSSEFIESFNRATIFGNFYINVTNNHFTFPPRRVTDLHIENVQEFRNKVKHYTLQWTAPGENYDVGTAFEYEIKVFKSRDDVFGDFENAQVLTIDEWKIHGPWLQPEIAGTIQTTTIQLNNITTGPYFISIRAKNSFGCKGDPSNIIEVYYITPSTQKAEGITDNSGTGLLIPSTEINKNADIQASDLGIVVGVVCGLLFLMLLIGFALIVYFAKYHRLQEAKNAKLDNSPFTFGNGKTESNDTLCHSLSSVLKDEENVSVISPVSSWSAGALLSHYEKVQVSKYNNPDSLSTRNCGDNLSRTSSIYLDVSKIPNQFPSEYDSVYNHHAEFLDNVVNPPFNPTYTSSLRRLSAEKSNIYKLGTDV